MNKIVKSICRYIEEQFSTDQPIIVAIDGRCGAGKSTLGSELQCLLDCNLIQMDDFFLRPEQRTEQRFAEPGGNIDYERFLQEVLIPLKSTGEINFKPYLCSIGDLGEPIVLPKKRITVIEGSYSCHPQLRDYYDLKVFLSVDSELQMQRIIKRNGEQLAKRFRDDWIPLEEMYIRFCNVINCCELVFDE